jgi:hypothetical protein
MKKSDLWVWLGIGILLLFLWNASSLEFFQDTATLHGPPYMTSDATRIVGMMPTRMKNALISNKTNGSSDPTALIDGPVTQIMTRFWTNVYVPASSPLKASDVDTFLNSEPAPPYLTKDDLKTLLVAYFVTQQAGAANVASTTQQTAANAQQSANAAAAQMNAAQYAEQVQRELGMAPGYQTQPGWTTGSPAGGSGPSGGTGTSGGSGPSGGTGTSGGTQTTATPVCPTGRTFESSSGTCTGPTGPATAARCQTGYTLYSSSTGPTGGNIVPLTVWACYADGGPRPSGASSNAGAPDLGDGTTPWGTTPGQIDDFTRNITVGGPKFGGMGTSSLAGSSSDWSSAGSNRPSLLGPNPKPTRLPNTNSSGLTLTLPTAAQVGADSNSMYLPGSRVPTTDALGISIAASMPQFGNMPKMDYNPLPFATDYSVFMR